MNADTRCASKVMMVVVMVMVMVMVMVLEAARVGWGG
jgi:hypothetical protein